MNSTNVSTDIKSAGFAPDAETESFIDKCIPLESKGTFTD